MNIRFRLSVHKLNLRKNIHCNPHFQRSYEIDDFDFDVIEICEESRLAERESYWINFFNCLNRNFGYNQADVNKSRRNIFSQESKMKISAGLMKKFYKSGSSILMVGKDDGEVKKEFACLKEAACYLIENGFSKGKENVVRNLIGVTLKSKKVHIGKGYFATRQSAFGFKWRYK